MKFFDKPIRTKLKIVIISITLLTTILIFTGFIIYENIIYRKVARHEIRSKTDLVAESIGRALSTKDSSGAVGVLNTLRSQPNIICSVIYDEKGMIFSSYINKNIKIKIPPKPSSTGLQENDDEIIIYKPLLYYNTRVGTIYLSMQLANKDERGWSYLTIAVAVLMGALFFTFVVVKIFDKNISEPIINLARTMRHVSEEKDYSVRITTTKSDEIGFLSNTFNLMLEQIQQHHKKLRNTNEILADEINEREKTKNILKESEERFRSLFENHPLPMWVYDKETLQFLEVNEAAVMKYGYMREEFLNMYITDIRPKKEVPKLLENLKQGRNVRQQSGPWRHCLKNGERIDVEIFSCMTSFRGKDAVLVVVVDITEKLIAERELKASEERYRTTLESMMEGCQILDFDFKYIYLNDVAAGQGRRPKNEFIGKLFTEIYPDIENSEFFAALNRCMNERVSIRMPNKFSYPDGSVGWFDLDIEPVPEGVFILSKDITTEKKLNDELVKYREHLEELVKERTAQLDEVNKELEAFSYSVSHDLRAPLRHIDGFTGLLIKNIKDKLDAKGLHFLDMISDSVKQMGILIDELLVFSRMSRTEIRVVETNLNQIVEDVIRGFSHDTEGRDIKWKIAALAKAEADPSMIKLVFQNLIGNSLKYTLPREKVEIEIGDTIGDKEVIIYVKDNGVGFDMRYSDKLFGVFQRLHHAEEFEGTGIGLANVHRIVTRHGGRTWGEGEPGKGAKFYFTLPIPGKNS